jgi:DNA modification methylase
MNTIANKVKTLKTTDVQTFLSWEFNTLKDKNRDVTNLKNAIIKNGFSFPVFLWYGHNYVIDGTGRRKAVEELTKEGYDIPEIPYVEVEAATLEEARQKVLEASSSFGDITKKSFLDFVDGDVTFIDWETINFGGSKKLGHDDFIEDTDDQDDEVPELPFEPQTVLGDIYEIGGHRILCGDSTLHTDLKKLMDGHKADMVFTDPPYNNDKMDDEKFKAFLVDTFLQMKGNVKENAGCYVFHSHKTATVFEEALKENNYTIHTQLIWNKPSAGLGMNDYKTKHEPFYYCSITKPVFFGDRTNTTVWKVPNSIEKMLKWFEKQVEISEEGGATVWSMKRANTQDYVHPTQKPVELPVKALVNSSKKGDIVLDLFLGSGSTLIAAEKTGRNCYGMELDPRFVDVIVDVIVERYLQFTNQTTVIKNGEEIIWETNRVQVQD